MNEQIKFTRLFERLMREPEQAQHYHDIGVLLCQTGEIKISEKYLKKASELNPQDDKTLYYYATVLSLQSRWEKSAAAWQAYLELKPDNEYAIGKLADCFYLLGRYGEAAEAASRSKCNGKAGSLNES